MLAVYRKSSDYVFAGGGGRPLNSDILRKALQSTLRGMGIQFEQSPTDGLHLLRHTSGSLLLTFGAAISKQLRNGSVTATPGSPLTCTFIRNAISSARPPRCLAEQFFQQPESPLGESAN